MRPILKNAVQLVDITVVALVAGSIFGIWRGYDPAAYSARNLP